MEHHVQALLALSISSDALPRGLDLGTPPFDPLSGKRRYMTRCELGRVETQSSRLLVRLACTPELNGHEGKRSDRPVLRIRGGTRHLSDKAPAPAKAIYVG